MAAAAAIAGETRCVRPPRPWRPSKFRLLVEAQRSTWFQFVRVHGQAHAATRFSPLESGLDKDLVQAFLFRLLFDHPAAGNHHRADVVG